MRRQQNLKKSPTNFCNYVLILDSGIDVGQGITVGPGKFGKTTKCSALNKRRATIIKLRNIHRNWKIFNKAVRPEKKSQINKRRSYVYFGV